MLISLLRLTHRFFSLPPLFLSFNHTSPLLSIFTPILCITSSHIHTCDVPIWINTVNLKGNRGEGLERPAVMKVQIPPSYVWILEDDFFFFLGLFVHSHCVYVYVCVCECGRASRWQQLWVFSPTMNVLPSLVMGVFQSCVCVCVCVCACV